MRFCHVRFFAIGLIVVMGSTAHSKDDNPAYNNAKEAGADYDVQGEYVGMLEDGNRWAAQVIADGDGKFTAVGYMGGLPGDGWSRGDTSASLKGKRDGDEVIFEGAEFVLRIKDGQLGVESVEGDSFGSLKKVERKSDTLGKKPPANAKVLFDGSNVDHWTNGKIIEGKLLGATNVESKDKLGDHKLHLEFRTPFMPKSRGQGRGNSGVYLQGRYEVQVLDSFGLEGKDNECGGIYSISPPDVNMCLPPLAWQTYDIDFTAAKYDGDKKIKNARATIKHNGVVIHDDLELPNGTPGRHPEAPGPQVLFLQDHSNPVAYRNIWVVEE
ncbi:MAG: DUF1080 domain-containing protein [Pirellulaceae bacterium]|nr:DUF1080 domain-containing protein [Pirellulaceae bacterium]